ncbi:MAG: dethiobiotin synthase [Pseudomonadota bacterium]
MTRERLGKGFFVTGTDTGVGKTLVAAGLIGAARARGFRAVGVKPIETGCAVKDGILHPEDGTLLYESSSPGVTMDDCCPLRFSLPASPMRAAAMEDRKIHLADIEEHIRTIARDADFTVVEGAGGVMVPIEGTLTMMDLISRLNYPVVLVARSALGTVNHTLLTVEALARRNITTLGIVISKSSHMSGPEEDYTPSDIARMVGDIPVLRLPYQSEETRRDASAIARLMDELWPPAIFNEWFFRP